MQIKKAYKFRLKPSKTQCQQLQEIAGCCRFVWNKIYYLNQERLANKQGIIWYEESDFWSKLWKASDEYSFLKVAPAQCLQQKLMDLAKAYKDGFDKSQPLKRLPKPKRRYYHNSFRFPQPSQVEINNRRIKLPKLGWIGFSKSRDIEGELRNVTVSQDSGHWYISVQVEQTLPAVIHPSKSCIGLDLGIKKFAALSTLELIESPHAYKVLEKKLAKAQRKLAKKQRFSQNWKKQKAKIQKLHSKIAHVRRDFQHKLSTLLSKSHAMIVVEDLKISNMSKSAKGTLDDPGRNVKAKSGLNKSILDQGWGEFLRQLNYKLGWLGGFLLKVAPQYTSQRCHRCGHTERSNRPKQEIFCCQACGFEMNADINAARNILAAGHVVLACGESGLPFSMKQEPLGIGNLVPA